MSVTWQIFASTADFLFVRPARLKNLTAAGFLFASDPLFTGAMSVVEKTERDPENGDQENGESSKEGKSGNFLDPMKVFIHNLVKWVGYSRGSFFCHLPPVILASQIFLPSVHGTSFLLVRAC